MFDFPSLLFSTETVLYSTLLYSTILYSTALYYTMLYCTILNYAPLCHLMLCSAMHSTLLCSALLSSGLLSSPLLYSTLIYSSILHHTILCICTEENLGESAEEVYSNYTNARLQKGQHLHHHSKSLLLDSHILTKTVRNIEETPPKASLGISSGPRGT